MTRYTRSEIISGLFVTLAIVLFALYAFGIVNVDPLAFLKKGRLICVADLSDAAGLDEGAVVSVAGHSVGKVTAVGVATRTLDDAEARRLIEVFGADAFPDLQAGMTRQVAEVRFEITDANLHIDPETAKVSLQRDGLLGRLFLALDPGYWSGDQPRAIELAQQDPLRIRGEDTIGMMEMMAQLAPVIDRAKRLLANADAMLTENRPHLKNMIANADGMLEENRPTIQSLLTNADELIVENRPRIEALLEDLRSAANTLEEKLALVADDAERLLELTRDMLEENRPEIAETVRRLRRTMWEAEMAMRKIRANPAYLIFGDEEQLLNQSPYDATWIRRSGRAEPFEQRDENVEDGDEQ